MSELTYELPMPEDKDGMESQVVGLYEMGARDLIMIMHPIDMLKLYHMYEGQDNVVKSYHALNAGAGQSGVGYIIQGYIHPQTGKTIPIVASVDAIAGTITYKREECAGA